MKTDTLYKSLVGGSMAWVAYFFGGVDHLIKALLRGVVIGLAVLTDHTLR